MKRTNALFLIILVLIFTIFPNGHGYSKESSSIFIKVDLWKNELYVIENEKIIQLYKIAPGTEESPTPIGTFKVNEKSKSWGGGFGSRWLGLNVPWGVYGIHGTNKPWLIGKKASSGCIRMRNQDVEELFDMVTEGTTVHIEGPITGIGKGELINLSVGSKGNLVQLVQERLKFDGIYKGKVNGIYDIETERAVKTFQRNNNIAETGVISKREYLLLGILE